MCMFEARFARELPKNQSSVAEAREEGKAEKCSSIGETESGGKYTELRWNRIIVPSTSPTALPAPTFFHAVQTPRTPLDPRGYYPGCSISHRKTLRDSWRDDCSCLLRALARCENKGLKGADKLSDLREEVGDDDDFLTYFSAELPTRAQGSGHDITADQQP
ncbi:hypothetical protein C8J57DRAFT_1231623 [Mycena rebaudengoi]|nr:hypothetical protein C8J57DRAFT_1231623 [Mycena rebaudengoi]